MELGASIGLQSHSMIRSWQVEVVGPINGGLYGNGPWASLVISNFWHQVQNVGGQISTDGLNYDYFGFPDRDESLDVMEVDLSPESLGPEWDFTKPHKEMRASSSALWWPVLSKLLHRWE